MAKPRLKKPRDAHGDPIYSGTLYVACKSVRCAVGDKSIRVIDGTLRRGDDKHLTFPDVAAFYKPVGTNDPGSRGASTPKDNMLTATKSGVVTIDGRRETITKGRTRVVAGHELAQAHPEYFGLRARPAPKATRKTSTARPAASTKRKATTPKARSAPIATRSKEPIELWFTGTPCSVAFGNLSDEVQGQIRSCCRHEAGHAAVAARLGWRIDKVTARADGSGVNALMAPEGLDKRERLRQMAIICYAGRIAQGHSLFSREQDAGDQQQINDAVEYLTGRRFDDKTHRALQAEAQRFFNDPTFVRQVDVIAKALLDNDGALDGDDVRRLLRRRAA